MFTSEVGQLRHGRGLVLALHSLQHVISPAGTDCSPASKSDQTKPRHQHGDRINESASASLTGA